MITLNSKGESVEIKEIPIDVKALESQKAKLELLLANLPTFKKEPDKETLDLWNKFIQQKIDGGAEIKRKIEEIESKLSTISDLK